MPSRCRAPASSIAVKLETADPVISRLRSGLHSTCRGVLLTTVTMLNTNTIMGMLIGAVLLGVGGMVGYAVGLKNAPNTGFGTATTVYPPAVSGMYPPLPRSNTAGGTELPTGIHITPGAPAAMSTEYPGYKATPTDTSTAPVRGIVGSPSPGQFSPNTVLPSGTDDTNPAGSK